MAVVSDAADAAERSAPGHPADGVLWAQLADRSREDARPSWSFFAFLLLATFIAGIGRLLDQPILIIGAMVVGPEFAPVAAICYAIVRRKPKVAGMAATTLLGGFALCALIAWAVWAILYALGIITFIQATTGPLTESIISPDAWSFVIALLAGVAGVLSLTTSKSSALVGVFISITTVPAVGTIGLTLAVALGMRRGQRSCNSSSTSPASSWQELQPSSCNCGSAAASGGAPRNILVRRGNPPPREP